MNPSLLMLPELLFHTSCCHIYRIFNSDENPGRKELFLSSRNVVSVHRGEVTCLGAEIWLVMDLGGARFPPWLTCYPSHHSCLLMGGQNAHSGPLGSLRVAECDFSESLDGEEERNAFPL